MNWTETSSLPMSIASQSLFVYNSTLYLANGSNFTIPQVLVSATFTNNGQLTNWTDVNYPNSSSFWHTSAFQDNHFYLLGGADMNINIVSNVYLGKVDSNNTVTWQETAPLPQKLALGASVIINNKIYFAGGNTQPNYNINEYTSQNIYSSDIQADGALSEWSLAGELPEKLIGFGMLNVGNYIYIVGGKGINGNSAQVYRTEVYENGTINQNWQTLNPLPDSLWRFGVTKVENVIITAGGQSSDGTITDSVYYSIINPDGTLTPWEEGPKLPYPNCCSPLASNGNFIYLVGGHDGSNYTNRVMMNKLLIATPAPTISPTPIPNPTISPSPTATISPTPNTVSKIIFVPGIGASWNVDALMNCKEKNYTGAWGLAPFAKDIYKQVFEQLLLKGWGVVPLYYDWRLDVRENATSLDKLINSVTAEDELVNLLGHSMGGLIGRSYIETQTGGKTNKFLAVGSPFQGSALSYPAYVNSEVWTNDLVEKIGATLFFKHCGVPQSFHNLIPTYNYLRDQRTQKIKDVNHYKLQNNYLPTNFQYPFWGVKVGTLAGTGFPTLKTIAVTNSRTWIDGKPTNKENTNNGDGTVLVESAQIPLAKNFVINQTHSGIIGSTEGINKILEFFGSQAVPDPPFNEQSSALILVGHPGNFWLKDKFGKVYESEEGVISIFSPKEGDYELQIVPRDSTIKFIAAQFLSNGKVYYKEYTYKGFVQTPKIVSLDSKRLTENIIREISDFPRPNFPKHWWFIWKYLNKGR